MAKELGLNDAQMTQVKAITAKYMDGALGVVFGIAIAFVLVHHVILPARMGGPREGPMPIDRMTRDLDLDADQQEKVRAILERGHETMRGVLDETSLEIRAVLRPDQQAKFDRMRPRSPFPHGGLHDDRHGGGPPEPTK
jgi:Spy/CpxP family protein refolding chaperone